MLNKQLKNKRKLERGLLHKPGAVKMLFCDSSPGVVKWAADAWEVTDLTHWDAESGQPSFEKKKAEGRSEKRGDADRRTGSQEPSTHYNQKQTTKWNFFTLAAFDSWWEKKSLAMCNYPVKAEAMDNQILKSAGWWGLLSINQSL